MTKAEREKVEQAIRYLMADESEGGNFDKGIDVLCRLVGRTYPPAMTNPRKLSIAEAAAAVRALETSSATQEEK